MKPIKFLIYFLILITLSVCCKKEGNHSGYTVEGYTAIQASPDLVNKYGLKFKSITSQFADSFIITYGYITDNPVALHKLLSPLTGVIGSVYVSQNQLIKKGTSIITIEDAYLLSLQQRYLEAKNQYEFSKAEFARQGELTVENATSMKKLQIAKRDFQSAELNYKALQQELKSAGLEPDNLKVDNLKSVFRLKTPWTGTVKQITVQNGANISKGDLVSVIVETDKKYINITVPEVAFLKIRENDTLKSWPTYDSLHFFKSIVVQKDDHLNPETHAGVIFAVVQPDLELINGLSITTKIPVKGKTFALINKSAVFIEHDREYVFTKKHGCFLKVPVRTESNHKIIKLIDFPASFSDSIVINGAHRLNRSFPKP